MRTLIVSLALGFGACSSGGPCVTDGDCEPGNRCNTALSTPACQRLYGGGAGSVCSAGFFCQSKACVKQACAAVGGPPALGEVIPLTTTYERLRDGGFAPNVLFSDDARNDCAASQTRSSYGKAAVLQFRTSTPLGDGQVVPWVTDDAPRTGRAPDPHAVFLEDTLSGLDLRKHAGSATVVHVPTAADGDFRVRLESADGGTSGLFVAKDVCP